MFKRILIPIDSSKSSEQAARLAIRFAKRIDAKVLVVHVAYRQALLDLESDGLERTAYLRFGQQLLAPWPEIGTNHGVKLETRLLEGEGLGVAETILRTAASENCDLIAMSTEGREGLGRLLLGSIAERVVRLSDVPVLLVRQSVTGGSEPFTRLLIPVDGSVASNKALRVADGIAVQSGAELELLHVIPDVPMPMADPTGINPLLYNYEEWIKALEQESQKVIATTKASITTDKVGATIVRATGKRTAEVILNTARDKHADLIVMGTHGRGGFDRLLLGSVAEGVAHHANVPVLLVRSPESES